MRKVEAVGRMYQTMNDLQNRLGDARCTILADETSQKSDAPKMTMERAISYAKEFDPSFVVTLGKNDIPLFLYNSSGKFT